MFTFAGFEDYQLSEWATDGLVKRSANTFHSVTASLKSAGAIIGVALAIVSSPSMAVETAAVAGAQTPVSLSASESMLVVEHVNRMSKEIHAQITNLDHVDRDAVDPKTLSLADQVIAMMNAGGTAPSQGWAARVAIGKASLG